MILYKPRSKNFWPQCVYSLFYIYLSVPLSGCMEPQLWWAGSSLRCMGFSVFLGQGISCLTTCGIWVRWPGTEPRTPALECEFLITGPCLSLSWPIPHLQSLCLTLNFYTPETWVGYTSIPFSFLSENWKQKYIMRIDKQRKINHQYATV